MDVVASGAASGLRGIGQVIMQPSFMLLALAGGGLNGQPTTPCDLKHAPCNVCGVKYIKLASVAPLAGIFNVWAGSFDQMFQNVTVTGGPWLLHVYVLLLFFLAA